MASFGRLTLFWRASLGAALVAVVTAGVASASLYAELREGLGHGVEHKLRSYLTQIAVAAAAELLRAYEFSTRNAAGAEYSDNVYPMKR